MAYVYKHIKKEDNSIFYIGIGSDKNYKRAYSKSNRTCYWKNIANQGYKIEIIEDNLDWKTACNKEKELISYYGRKDLNKGTLINFTNGGEGIPGIIRTEETRDKIRKGLIGNKNSLGKKRKYLSQSKERIEKSRTRMLGNNFAKSKKVIDSITNIIYNSVKEASVRTNIPERTLTRWLKGITKNKSNLKYYEYNP